MAGPPAGGSRVGRREPRSCGEKEFQWKRLGASDLTCRRRQGKAMGRRHGIRKASTSAPRWSPGAELGDLGGEPRSEAAAGTAGSEARVPGRQATAWLVDTCCEAAEGQTRQELVLNYVEEYYILMYKKTGDTEVGK